MRRSGGDGEAVTVSSASDESLLILEDGSALSVEVASLHSQLEEERGKRLKLEKGKEKLDRELEESKAKNLALHRRYQDATRAYDQERRVSWGWVRCGGGEGGLHRRYQDATRVGRWRKEGERGKGRSHASTCATWN